MHSSRNRLLLLLVILSVVAFVATSAQAALSRGYTTGSVSYSVDRPTIAPTSGEPDVPQNGKVVPPTMANYRASKGAGLPLSQWLRLTGRIWMVRYLGVK